MQPEPFIENILALLGEIKSELDEVKTDLHNQIIEAGNKFDKLTKEVDKITESLIQINDSFSDIILSNQELKRKITLLNLNKRVRILENIVLNKAS